MASSSSPCAYCLNECADIVDPRELPCHHVFCFGCLEDALHTQPNKEMFKCPVCRVEHTLGGPEGIALSPAAVLLSSEIQSGQGLEACCASDGEITGGRCCDTCSGKGMRRTAATFCQQCDLKMCESHNRSHDHLWGEHKHHVISFEEFSRQRDRVVAYYCSEHSKEPLEYVCVKCKKLFCLSCCAHAVPMDCVNGEEHEIRSVLGVGEEMKKRLSEAMEPVILLQSKVDKLIIQSDERLTSAVTELDGLIVELHKARDLQLQEIRNAYVELEEKINKAREDTINQYREYHERLREEVNRLQSACKEADQVLASGSNIAVALQAEHVIQYLTAESLSEADPPSISKVEIIPLPHSRFTEVDLLITAPPPQSVPPAGIRALHLDKRILTQGLCYAVGHSAEGHMVVCRQEGLDYLDITGNVTSSLELGGMIHSCCLYNNSVYVVHFDNDRRWIRIYDMGGHVMQCWPVSDTKRITKLAVADEMIFLPNPDTKLIEVYTSSGGLLYSFTHPSFISLGKVTAADDQHIIVTDYLAQLVSKFNISDNSLVWKYKDVHHPSGTAADERGRIWVASFDEKCVHVLSADGQLLVKLDVVHADHIHGISVYGDQLAVANGIQKELLLYKITT